jgi:uncharacterized membrane protein HdeD (DUF308 family)
MLSEECKEQLSEMPDAKMSLDHTRSAWTFASGGVTLLLAIIAVFLPDIEWMPKGGLVGWLLLLAGIVELGFGLARGLDRLGVTAMVSGLFTVLAGLVFVANPSTSYFPVANAVMLWLAVRGAWVLLMALKVPGPGSALWLGLSGVTDVLLSFVLAAGLPVAVLVVSLFGPTPYIVAQFSLILASSFLITGLSQIAIASLELRDARERAGAV